MAFLLLVVSNSVGFAQIQEKGASTRTSSSPPGPETDRPNQSGQETVATKEPPGGKRVFGVLPNYRTVDESQVTGPLGPRQKLTIAAKDSFDYPLILLAGGLAGLGQWSNENPSFGQGMAGFSKRLVTAYGDQALGNIMTEGLFPMMLREDPRYYRRGDGSGWSRTGYALSRIFVTHTDSAGLRFNYSEWLGNGAATAISNAYYSDGRTVGANVTKLVEQCSIDGLSQVLKEFWPDIKHKFFEHTQSTGASH